MARPVKFREAAGAENLTPKEASSWSQSLRSLDKGGLVKRLNQTVDAVHGERSGATWAGREQ
jgi:hypothetical protein